MGIFKTINSTLPSTIPRQAHPLAVPDSNDSTPVQTNKFYGNMLLGDRCLTTFPHPYTVWWTAVADFYGLGISHTTASQRIFGPNANVVPCQYFYNPTMVMSMCLSANEFFDNKPNFSTRNWGPLSIIATLTDSTSAKYVMYPVVNGMGFVTGVYAGLKPVVSSQVAFTTIGDMTVVRRGISKLKVVLSNGVTWLIYVYSPSNSTVGFTTRDSNHIYVDSTESPLVVQTAVLYDADAEATYDAAAGSYAITASLDGSVTADKNIAIYNINYELRGTSATTGTLVWALPHQVESFTATMNGKVTNYMIDSTVMGQMRLCVTNTLEMYERLPRDQGFLPWTVNKTAGDSNFSTSNWTSAEMELLTTTLTNEIAGIDFASACNLSSMYFSGKILCKFAQMLLVAKFIVNDTSLTSTLLTGLKAAMAVFTANTQQTPLFYDTAWGGICSQAGISDPGADFGNTYYNDHHFHYGYFIYTAAVIGHVDAANNGTWATDNKDWVSALIRDVAASGSDADFPQFRMFDWFQGHSLAKGLFASGDGKDEESSSEDYHCYYGMKLWANVIGDADMEYRANLILAIERRAMNKYMLYSDDNTTEPSQIIGNKVSGIKFENKIDHTTYFGLNLEYIQGIHMLPITPISSFIRNPTFVQQEWEQKLASIVDGVNSGWRGILQLNRALYDPTSAYAFFAQTDFNSAWLDDGLSRTWALAFTKGVQF